MQAMATSVCISRARQQREHILSVDRSMDLLMDLAPGQATHSVSGHRWWHRPNRPLQVMLSTCRRAAMGICASLISPLTDLSGCDLLQCLAYSRLVWSISVPMPALDPSNYHGLTPLSTPLSTDFDQFVRSAPGRCPRRRTIITCCWVMMGLSVSTQGSLAPRQPVPTPHNIHAT